MRKLSDISDKEIDDFYSKIDPRTISAVEEFGKELKKALQAAVEKGNVSNKIYSGLASLMIAQSVHLILLQGQSPKAASAKIAMLADLVIQEYVEKHGQSR